MGNVFVDCGWDDERRRGALYAGDMFVFNPNPAALRLVRVRR